MLYSNLTYPLIMIQETKKKLKYCFLFCFSSALLDEVMIVLGIGFNSKKYGEGWGYKMYTSISRGWEYDFIVFEFFQ